jgi:hypothetical protein
MSRFHKSSHCPYQCSVFSRANKAVHAAENSGWSTGPSGVLDQLDLHSAGAAQRRDQRVLHARGSEGEEPAGSLARKFADDTGDYRGCALRLQPVRSRQESDTTLSKLANFVNLRSPGWENPADDRRGQAPGRRTRRSEQAPRRALGLRTVQPVGRSLHHDAWTRTADDGCCV